MRVISGYKRQIEIVPATRLYHTHNLKNQTSCQTSKYKMTRLTTCMVLAVSMFIASTKAACPGGTYHDFYFIYLFFNCDFCDFCLFYQQKIKN